MARIPRALLLALFIRSLSLLLPHTFFQPDEFYQALEPAHRLVFGYGHLTWEWRDLPGAQTQPASGDGAGYEWWDELVVKGRLRGWIWPGVFALLYKALEVLGLDGTRLIVFAPRLIGVLVAALTDYSTYCLAAKFLGEGASAGATVYVCLRSLLCSSEISHAASRRSQTQLFLSLTSLFNAHLLPRALSTSPETLLTTFALTYFPFPEADKPTAIKVAVGEKELVASSSMRDVRKAAVGALEGAPEQASARAAEGKCEDVKVDGPGELNYVIMDRIGPDVIPRQRIVDSLPMAAALAALAVCIRPTTLPLWAYLGGEHLVWRVRREGLFGPASEVVRAGLAALTVFCGSTAIDYAVTGRLTIPTLTFIRQNVLLNLSSFYGSTTTLYHLTQSLPIMLLPIWFWWAQGFACCLLCVRFLPKTLATLDRPAGLRMLARALTFAIATLSLSPHSEWRFLHPFLPSLLLFALPPLFRSFVPTILGCYHLMRSIRQYTRIPSRPFYLILCAPLVPYLYLNGFHGRAQVAVMDVLRRGDMGEVTGLMALMPCHSTPWMSALHRDVPAWFLTCEPPLGVDPSSHITQQGLFYSSPVSYLSHIFPFTPMPLHQISDHVATQEQPSHVMLFGELLARWEIMEKRGRVMVGEALETLGYREVWKGWNGFDWAQDEPLRRGGVRVWAR